MINTVVGEDDLSWLDFSSVLSGGIRAVTLFRFGGVSPPPFDSLNISYRVGDRPDNVRENRARIKKALGVEVLAAVGQVHGNRILKVPVEGGGEVEEEGFDAMVTRGRAALMIQQADCQAVAVFDPVKRVTGLIHVGWRGNVNEIIGDTIALMQREYHCSPSDLLAVIAPSLGPCCAEFKGFQKLLPPWMHRFQVKPEYFDFPAVSRFQLQEAGLSRERIAGIAVCSRCDRRFFSHRRSPNTGRFGTVIMM